MSHAMRVPDCEGHLKESKSVHDITSRDIKIGLSEMEHVLMDLKQVAYFHPDDGVAQFAQVVLADVAALVLRTWPADAAKSVQPTFDNLYVMKGGAFRLRWDRQHKTGRRKPGDRKRDFLYWLLFYRVWPLYQTCSHDVLEDVCGLRSVDFNDVHRSLYDADVVRNLRAFYQSVPNLISDCQKSPKDAFSLKWRSLLLHFDLFWKTVIDPCIFEGQPSVWEETTKGAFNGSKAPSKHRPQLKRLLLEMLRGSIPDIVVKTSVDS